MELYSTTRNYVMNGILKVVKNNNKTKNCIFIKLNFFILLSNISPQI